MAIHNYGGNHEPERDPGDCGICFRRAEIYRQVMVEQGDAATPIWATEFGWLLDPGQEHGPVRLDARLGRQAGRVRRPIVQVRPEELALDDRPAALQPGRQHLAVPHRPAERDAVVRDPEQGPLAASGLEGVQGVARGRRRAGRRGRSRAWHERAAGAAGCRPPPAPDAGDSRRANARRRASTPTPSSLRIAESATPTPTPPHHRPATPSLADRPTRLRVGKTDGTGANLRERPSSEAKAIAILMDGTTVEVIGEDVKAGGDHLAERPHDRQHDGRRDRLGGRAVPRSVGDRL